MASNQQRQRIVSSKGSYDENKSNHAASRVLVPPTTTFEEVTPRRADSIQLSSEDHLATRKRSVSIDDVDEDPVKPKRPLSAYNLFFQEQRRIMLATRPVRPEGIPIRRGGGHGKVGFAELAQTVAAKWKVIDPQEKQKYEAAAQEEKSLYEEKLALWKQLTLSKTGPAAKKNKKVTAKNKRQKTQSQPKRQPDQQEQIAQEDLDIFPEFSSVPSRNGDQLTRSLSQAPPDLRSCCSSPLFGEEESLNGSQSGPNIVTKGETGLSTVLQESMLLMNTGHRVQLLRQTPPSSQSASMSRLVTPESAAESSLYEVSHNGYISSSNRNTKKNTEVCGAFNRNFSLVIPNSPLQGANGGDNSACLVHKCAPPQVFYPEPIDPQIQTDFVGIESTTPKRSNRGLVIRPILRRPGKDESHCGAGNTDANAGKRTATVGCSQGSTDPYRPFPFMSSICTTPIDKLKRYLDYESLEFFVDLFKRDA